MKGSSTGSGSTGWAGLGLLLALALLPQQSRARPAGIAPSSDISDDAPEREALPYLQCVPYARRVSGIELYGDALTWWDQAKGHYARGHVPRIGAVMSFRPYGAMQLGHVAAVSRVIDSRTVLLRHANWSPIDGHRGQIEDGVRAVDVSPDNDWSEVRVWYAPIGDLGTTRWPVNGFIYNRKPGAGDERPATILARRDDRPHVTMLMARDSGTIDRRPAGQSASRIDASFLDGIEPEHGTAGPTTRRTHTQATRTMLVARAGGPQDLLPDAPGTRSGASRTRLSAPAHGSSLRDDPIGRIIASRMGHNTNLR